LAFSPSQHKFTSKHKSFFGYRAARIIANLLFRPTYIQSTPSEYYLVDVRLRSVTNDALELADAFSIGS
jgi:hypothetical protein